MDRTEKTVAEYFAGIGLVRMGLESAGWRVVFANDFDYGKLAMYSGFFSDAEEHYVLDDVFNLKAANIPRATLATCSFPCIDLSLAGNMNGLHGNHSSAFLGFTEILKAQGEERPPLLLVENVPGWLSSNNGEDFRVTVNALNELGYACDVFLLDARRFVPQSRNRVFLIGDLGAQPTKEIEPILQRSAALSSNRLRRSVEENNDLRWFHIDIADPPPLLTTGLSEFMESLAEDDERWWTEGEVQRHLEMMTPLHRDRVEELRSRDQYSFRTFYRRRRNQRQRAEVRKDDVAGCLRTAVGGSSRQFVVRVGRGQVRMRLMTAREYARLQGVPDDYEIRANGNQALTGFGDAVCVPAIQWIAENVLSYLV